MSFCTTLRSPQQLRLTAQLPHQLPPLRHSILLQFLYLTTNSKQQRSASAGSRETPQPPFFSSSSTRTTSSSSKLSSSSHRPNQLHTTAIGRLPPSISKTSSKSTQHHAQQLPRAHPVAAADPQQQQAQGTSPRNSTRQPAQHFSSPPPLLLCSSSASTLPPPAQHTRASNHTEQLPLLCSRPRMRKSSSRGSASGPRSSSSRLLRSPAGPLSASHATHQAPRTRALAHAQMCCALVAGLRHLTGNYTTGAAASNEPSSDAMLVGGLTVGKFPEASITSGALPSPLYIQCTNYILAPTQFYFPKLGPPTVCSL